jgi:transcriptional regulator with XRE-family HTH domain
MAHPVSPAVATALTIIGHEVRLARLERGWTLEELAERAGVSEKTVRSVESGSTRAAVGTVFELGWLVGLNLLDRDDADLPQLAAHENARLALAPKRVRRSSRPPRARF